MGEAIGDSLKRMRQLMNRLPEARFRVEMAESKAAKCTSSITGMPRWGCSGESQVESGVERILLARERLQEILAELEALENKLQPRLGEIDSPLERRVMHMRYFDRMSVKDISFRLAYSEPYIFRLLSKAERKLEG